MSKSACNQPAGHLGEVLRAGFEQGPVERRLGGIGVVTFAFACVSFIAQRRRETNK